MEKLWSAVDGTTTEKDEEKKLANDVLAKSRLILLVDPVVCHGELVCSDN